MRPERALLVIDCKTGLLYFPLLRTICFGIRCKNNSWMTGKGVTLGSFSHSYGEKEWGKNMVLR